MSSNRLFKPCVIESKQFSDLIQKKESLRIINALGWSKSSDHFDLAEVTEEKLQEIADLTNNANLHLSGNCTLITYAMLYNLKFGRIKITVNNTYPLYLPVNQFQSSLLLFGDYPQSLRLTETTVQEVAQNLKEKFKATGERAFLVGLFYRTFGIRIGHCLNAVILGKDESIRVVFVDAWKTSKQIYTPEKLEKRYPGEIIVDIQYFERPIRELQQQRKQVKQNKRSELDKN